ncbi:MAG TPA: hypothetical protein VHM70_07310 [Polyangiaceae bacterium]|jgi:hypothetical protein|nr:hypothetical protein [Polyangiaceae bacterium]
MSSKGIADRFIQEFTSDDTEAGSQPRVILVRSTKSIKQFITEALGEVERLVTPVKEARANWALLVAAFDRLAELAKEYEQHNIQIAAQDIRALALHLDAMDWGFTPELQKTFSDFVTYLSTMLLRVYIEGKDEKCVWELASIEVLLTQSRRQLRMATNRDHNQVHWLN